MIRAITALGLSLILVSGCATPPGAIQAPVNLNAASASFEPLASLLADAPDGVGVALLQVWQRTQGLPQASPVDATRLTSLLEQAEQPSLQAARRFEQVLAVVQGEDAPVRTAFAEALSRYYHTDEFDCRQPVHASYCRAIYG